MNPLSNGSRGVGSGGTENGQQGSVNGRTVESNGEGGHSRSRRNSPSGAGSGRSRSLSPSDSGSRKSSLGASDASSADSHRADPYVSQQGLPDLGGKHDPNPNDIPIVAELKAELAAHISKGRSRSAPNSRSHSPVQSGSLKRMTQSAPASAPSSRSTSRSSSPAYGLTRQSPSGFSSLKEIDMDLDTPSASKTKKGAFGSAMRSALRKLGGGGRSQSESSLHEAQKNTHQGQLGRGRSRTR